MVLVKNMRIEEGSFTLWLFSSACRHVVVDKFEIGQGKLFFHQLCQFLLDRFGPMTYEHDELVDSPCNSATWNLSIIAFELCIVVFGLGTEILFGPYLTMQMWVVDERLAFFCSIFYLTRSDLFFTHTKKRVVIGIIPENTYGRHRLIERTHVVHLRLMIYLVKVGHILLCFKNWRMIVCSFRF